MAESNDRWLFAAVDLTPGILPEDFILREILPWVSNQELKSLGLNFSFTLSRPENPDPGYESGWSLQFKLRPRTLDRNTLAGWQSELRNILEPFEARQQLSDIRIGTMDIDSDVHKFGGPAGLRIYESFDDTSSRAVLELAGSVGSIVELEMRHARLIQLSHRILVASCGHMTPAAAAHLVKRRVVDLMRISGLTEEQSALITSPASLAKVESTLLMQIDELENSDDESPWRSLLDRTSRKYLAHSGEIKLVHPEIERVVEFHEWVGRRLLHLNFCRFYFDAVNECILLLAFASLVDGGRFKWPS